MKYGFYSKSKPSNQINLEIKTLSGKLNLAVEGAEVKEVDRRQKRYNLIFEDGTSNMLKIKQNYFGLNITAYLDEEKIQVTPPIAWYEYITSLLPAVLLIGGALGAVIGIVAISINISRVHKRRNKLIKILLNLTTSAIAVILYLIIAIVINSAIKR